MPCGTQVCDTGEVCCSTKALPLANVARLDDGRDFNICAPAAAP